MTTSESKILKYKNINILKEKTDKKFNLYTLINNKNELLNGVQFRKIEDCKMFINEILKGDENNEF
jgi:hypothetical protein